MPTPSHLTGKQRRFLRSRGHTLQPVAQVGRDGLSAAFVHAVDQALETHELIKIRVGQNAIVDRKDAAAQLAVETDSHVAQIIGSIILLYRRHPEDPVIRLP